MSSVEFPSLEKLMSWKLNELKKSCKEFGLQSSGTKAELAERLHMYHVTAAEQAASSELNEAELLGELDESIDASAASKELVAQVPAEAPKAPVAASKLVPKPAKVAKPGIKRKVAPEKKAPAAAATTTALATEGKISAEQPEKSEESDAKPEAESNEMDEHPKSGKGDVAAKVPVSKMTEEERKLARAKRFGLGTDGAGSGPQELTVLEKRAARFGEVLSPTLQKTVEAEKLQKRLERFGETGKSSISDEERKRKRTERFQDGASSDLKKSSYDEEEKKRRRLERFGGATATVSATSSPGGDADKLARRAERFGVESEEAKKAARAKRFGITA